MAFAAALALALLPALAGGVQPRAPRSDGLSRASPPLRPAYSPSRGSLRRAEAESGVGVMNKHGITRYRSEQLVAVPRAKFYLADPGDQRRYEMRGSVDLSENVTWGWHHPNGVYNTIPVGAPLIDGDQNIYVGSDDSIRKFSLSGSLIWKYGPRGQLAAAPSLVEGSTQREMQSQLFQDEDSQQEDMLKPTRMAPEGNRSRAAMSSMLFKDVRVGDHVRVKPGVGYHADGKEFYKAGDMGKITKITSSTSGEHAAVIHWERTGHSSLAVLAALNKRFMRIRTETRASTPRLVGSTTSGYVFAVDLATGEELWATEVSPEIHGVKGVVSAKDGVVVVATDRCTDRYCYRYRNLSNSLAPGNSKVRGLNAIDGSSLWEFKTTSPVWNMVPQYSDADGTVMFSDYEGTTYCLELVTGVLKWKAEGSMGTYTQSHSVFNPTDNIVYGMGLQYYDDKVCNPFPAPGILPPCGTWPGKPGWLKAYSGSSGHLLWESDIPEPPASAAVGMLNSPLGHTRLVVAMGHNCLYNSPSQIWAIDPQNGHIRWKREGPTLWTDQCAGDKEGGDIRRAMGGRAVCNPGAWSTPAIDDHGDIYIGSQVGELQRWGTENGAGARHVSLLSTLNTGVAFQDNAIAFSPGIMAVTTCTSLIIFQTYDDSPTLANSLEMKPYWDHNVSDVIY